MPVRPNGVMNEGKRRLTLADQAQEPVLVVQERAVFAQRWCVVAGPNSNARHRFFDAFAQSFSERGLVFRVRAVTDHGGRGAQDDSERVVVRDGIDRDLRDLAARWPADAWVIGEGNALLAAVRPTLGIWVADASREPAADRVRAYADLEIHAFSGALVSALTARLVRDPVAHHGMDIDRASR